MSLTRGQPTEHVSHRDPHVPDARTATTLAWLDGYDVLIAHGRSLALFSISVQQRLARTQIEKL